MKKILFHFFVILALAATQGCNRGTETATAPVGPNTITPNTKAPQKSSAKREISILQPPPLAPSAPTVHPTETEPIPERAQDANIIEFQPEIEAFIANDNWLSDFILKCQHSLWNKLDILVLKNNPIMLCKSAQQAGIRVVATPRYTGFRKAVKDRNWDLLLQSLELSDKTPDRAAEILSLKDDAKRLKKVGSITGIYTDDYKRLLSNYSNLVKLFEGFHARIETVATGYDFKFNVISGSTSKPAGYLIFIRIQENAILKLSDAKFNSSKVKISDYVKLKTGISADNEIHYTRTSAGEEISCDLNELTFISLRPSTTLFETDNG